MGQQASSLGEGAGAQVVWDALGGTFAQAQPSLEVSREEGERLAEAFHLASQSQRCGPSTRARARPPSPVPSLPFSRPFSAREQGGGGSARWR